jgi:threonine dehydratase
MQPGKLAFPIILEKVDEMLLVSEEEIAKTTLFAINHHIWLEPSGALSIAAALNYSGKFNREGPVVCIVSGGNTNVDFICQLNAQI